MKYQLVIVSFVIAIVHGLDGSHRILGGGWWLGVDSLLGVGFHQLLMQVLGQLLMLLGLLFCSLVAVTCWALGLGRGFGAGDTGLK